LATRSLFGNTAIAATANTKNNVNKNAVSSQKGAALVGEVFDEYQHFMDDWDGKDESYKAEYDARLRDNLNDLIADGVSLTDIQTEMENRILNPKKKKEYRAFLESLKQQNLSEDKMAQASMNERNI